MCLPFLISGCATIHKISTNNNLEIHFIDVGYGDAIIIRTGETTCLIDGGYPSATHVVLEYMKKIGVDSLQAAFLTHPHPDHLGGLHGVVVSDVQINTIYSPFHLDSHMIPNGFRQEIQTQNIEYQVVSCNQKVPVNDMLIFQVIHPCEIHEDMNDSSLVLYLNTTNGNRVLLTADIGPNGQAELLNRQPDFCPITILKAPHHGGHSLPEFYQAMQPDITIICDGINPYGNPWQSTLDMANRWSKRVFRLSETGSIVLIEKQQGSSWEFQVKKSR